MTIPRTLKIQNIETAHSGYEDWSTFALRDRKTNGCVAVVGEVDRQFSEHTKEITDKLAIAYNTHDQLIGFAQMISDFFFNDSVGHAIYLKGQADRVLEMVEKVKYDLERN